MGKKKAATKAQKRKPTPRPAKAGAKTASSRAAGRASGKAKPAKQAADKKKTAAKKKVPVKKTVARKKAAAAPRSSKTADVEVTRKSPAKKVVAAKKPSAGKSSSRRGKPSTGKSTRTQTSSKSTSGRGAASRQSKRIGRSRIPLDAPLDIVFQRDLMAREAFAYLGIHTIRELEAFNPDELVRRLTSPAKQTVGRIRKALAMNNRHLSEDEEFAVEFQEQMHDRIE